MPRAVYNRKVAKASITEPSRASVTFDTNSAAVLRSVNSTSVLTDLEFYSVLRYPDVVVKPGESRYTHKRGWTVISDTEFTDLVPQEIEANTKTLLKINGSQVLDFLAGDFVDHAFIDNVDSFSPRAIGDAYVLRASMMLVSELADNEIEVELDIGNEVTPIVIAKERPLIRQKAGVPGLVTVNFVFYSLDTFKANGAKIFITSDTAAEVYGSSFFIIPVHAQ